MSLETQAILDAINQLKSSMMASACTICFFLGGIWMNGILRNRNS